MAQRFVQRDRLAAVEVQWSGLLSDGAGAAAVGAGQLRTKGLGLLLQGGRERAFSEAGGGSELFQGGEIEVEARAVDAESPSGDNFAPLGGQMTDILEVLGRNFAAGQRQSCLRVRENGKNGLSILL